MVGLGVYECRTKNSVFRVIARGITKLRDFPLALQNWYAGWLRPHGGLDAANAAQHHLVGTPHQIRPGEASRRTRCISAASLVLEG